MVIHKYTLDLNKTKNVISIPVKSIVLDAQMQGNDLCLWVLKTEGVVENRDIYIFATGQAFNFRNIRHISTIQLNALVLHIFEEIPL